MKTQISSVMCVGALALCVGTSHADFFAWSWERPAQDFIDAHTVGPNTYDIPMGQVNDSAGIIQQIMATFDTDTNQFGWSVTFSGQPDGSSFHTTNGFWLVVSPGAMPSAAGGQAAQIFFDASGKEPTLTAYAYNGQGDASSIQDGTGGGNAPDPILSSILSPGAILDLSVVGDPASSVTMSFLIDASSIQSHVPLYPGGLPWTGVGFADLIGAWMHPLTNVESSYSGGYLDGWDFARNGWWDGENQVIPTPGALAAMLGLGLVGSRRRRV